MKVRLLGALEIVVDGHTVALGGPKERALLALLAVHRGSCPQDRLIDDLWGDDPPPGARKTLQTYVWRLRNLLPEGAITSTAGGYQLHTTDESDLVRFEHLTGEAAGALNVGEAWRAGELYRDALELWRGEPFGGCARVESLQARRTWLEELHGQAVEGHLDAELRLGHHSDLIGELEHQVQTTPLHERLWEMLALALYRSGRQAEALRACRRARDRLVDELGISPSAALIELERRVLAQDPALAWNPPQANVRQPDHGEPAVRPVGTVTFLFTDIEDSTRLWEEHPTLMPDALARHDEILTSTLKHWGGCIFAWGGDGLAAAFQRAGTALDAAIDAQRQLRNEPWPDPVAVRVRMALHTGEAQERDGNYYGPPTNRASRLLRVAAGGQIVMSRATADVLGHHPQAELVDIGEHQLRGVPQPMPVFLVAAPGLDSAVARADSSPASASGGAVIADEDVLAASGNMPRPFVELIGRVVEVDRVVRLLRRGRLVTLSGPGGVGKTQLAVACAHAVASRQPDGAWLVSLASVANGDAVVAAAVEDLGLMLTAAEVDGTAIGRALADQQRLVVFDNCEHVLGAARELVARILDSCADVTLLATSREPLGLPGERVVAVPPLSTRATTECSDAARLFVARASEADPSFEPTADDRRIIDEVCARLDGLPLALELAAARVYPLGLAEVQAQIEGTIDPLRRRSNVGRHQSLTALVAWSYKLLSDDERTVFARLSVFADGFDLQAAVAVTGGPPVEEPVADILVSLVEQSLVTVATRGPIRYRQLEIIRQFAADRLAESPTASEATATRFLEHFVRWVAEADIGVRGRDEAHWSSLMRQEWGNLRAALQRALATGDTDAATSIVWHLFWWASLRAQLELGQWADSVLLMAGIHRHHARPIVIAVAADFARRRLEYDSFLERLAEAERLEDELGETPEPIVPYVAIHRDVTFRELDPPPAANDVARRGAGSAFWTAVAAWGDGYMPSVRASNAPAAEIDPSDVRRVEHSLAVAETLGNPSLIARTLELHGAVLRRSDPHRALAVLQRSLQVATDLDNEEVASFARWDLAMIFTDLGRLSEAVDLLCAALQHYRRLGAHSHAWDMSLAAIRPLVALGSYRAACLAIGRLHVRHIVSDWDEWVLPADTRERLARDVEAEQRDKWLEEGAHLPQSAIISQVADALAAVRPAPGAA